MIAYTVHEQPEPPADRLDRADALVFVRDGFSWAAALFAPFWFASRRLLLALACYIALVAAIAFAAHLLSLPPGWASVLTTTLHVLIGFEADTLQRMALESRGYTTVGTVVGRNADDCERRFFSSWLPSQPMIALPGAARLPAPPAQTRPAATQVVTAAPAEEKTAPSELSLWRRFLRGRAPR